MSLTITFQKKHFLMMGLIIAIPFLFLSINTIIATVPGGQYHLFSELFVDSDIDMNGNKLTNADEITIGSTTIKGDGSVSTGLNAENSVNAEKIGGYTSADLIAITSSGGNSCNDCDGDGHVSYSFCFDATCSNRGDDCNDNDASITTTGSTSYYCDIDGDGFMASTPSGSACGTAPIGCVMISGNDCNDNDADIYPGHVSKSSADGKDNNCNGQTDECTSSYCSVIGESPVIYQIDEVEGTQPPCYNYRNLCKPSGTFTIGTFCERTGRINNIPKDGKIGRLDSCCYTTVCTAWN